MTVEIPLTHSYFALIDDDDYERVAQFHWWTFFSGNKIYARTEMPHSKRGKAILLHRFVLDEPTGFDVDHKDRNGLNCQKYNLRLATKSQNQCNRDASRKGLSGYKGVSLFKRTGKWHAQITVNCRNIHLGYFFKAEDAARAYDAAALRFHGEFAGLNFKPQ